LLVILIINLFIYKQTILTISQNKRIHITGGKRLALFSFLVLFTSFFFFLTIWQIYGWRYSMLSNEKDRPTANLLWRSAAKKNNFPIKCIFLAKKYKFLPEAYLYGMTYVLLHSEKRDAFLDGKYSNRGWFSFFPLCFIYKTPIPIIILFSMSIAALISYCVNRKKRARIFLSRISVPLSIFVIYSVIAVLSRLNIGQRHLLPIYLPIFVFGGGICLLFKNYFRKIWIIMTTLLFSILITEILSIYPDYLSYFSPLIAGKECKYKHLVDSSLDWGQDIESVNTWIKNKYPRSSNKIYISYFGSVNMDIYDIKYKRLFCNLEQRSTSLFKFDQGIYCISATMLQMLYFSELVQWDSKLEKKFQEKQKFYYKILSILKNQQKLKILIKHFGIAHTENMLREYEKLRFAKLVYHLRKRDPDFIVHSTYLIFELSKEDIASYMK
jgi:hypothetical protein